MYNVPLIAFIDEDSASSSIDQWYEIAWKVSKIANGSFFYIQVCIPEKDLCLSSLKSCFLRSPVFQLHFKMWSWRIWLCNLLMITGSVHVFIILVSCHSVLIRNKLKLYFIAMFCSKSMWGYWFILIFMKNT